MLQIVGTCKVKKVAEMALTVILCMDVVTGPLKENQIAFVLHETLHGLQYLHGRGMMHRDVKV